MAKIEPYRPPSSIVAPHPSGPWSLDASERHLFDHYAQEHVQIHGTDVEFYSQEEENALRDPLYDELVTPKFRGPFKLRVYVEWASSDPSTQDRGYESQFNSTCWIPRKSLEDVNSPIPSEGDIIRFWKIPFFDATGVDNIVAPGSGYYFNLTDVDDDGHVFDNPDFVGLKATLSRNTSFTPERRLGGK